MPGFLTHCIAGKAALQAVSAEIREKITAEERLYNLGTQGPDIFFYYLPGQVRKRSRGIAQEMHGCGLGLFLAYMAKLAKLAPPQEQDTIFAYTAGFLMHYTVDCHAHPYVYARAFVKDAPKIKNSALHRKFETAIDVSLLKLVSGKKPAGINQWELINAPKSGLCIAAEALSHGICAIYNRNVPPKVTRRALQFTINATRLLQSKNGRRKRFMEIAENLVAGEAMASCIIHMQEVPDEDDYLNLKKTEWQAPWSSEEEKYTDSFMERYSAAVEEGAELIETMHSYIYGDLPFEVLTEKLGNRSLKTGLQCA
ncbi:MAG: zinc dependent phospholipase C family protein [Defluviitaleaceae bacterium]|nr:zinc dependent phospholipase C family protein [Defluviitaleaceae bacterium]MCL2261910.1 zinc dependent phospholipase C family protein [Defluviitaleaceae bacterium]